MNTLTPAVQPPTENRPIVVALCGDPRFYDYMLDAAGGLSAKGVIVLMPHFVISPDQHTNTVTARSEELNRHRIDMADQIVVVTDTVLHCNLATRHEVRYAIGQGKGVNWSVCLAPTGAA